MASGHANRTQAEHMAAPTQACDVRKVLANPEPSTHGTKRAFLGYSRMSALGVLRPHRRNGLIGLDNLVGLLVQVSG